MIARQITEALETPREPKEPDPTPHPSTEPPESMPQNTVDAAPSPTLPSAASPTAPNPPQTPAAEQTATIETTPAAGEPAAIADDAAMDTDIVPKKKKKKHVARSHFHRVPLRAVAQTSAPLQLSSWPAGIGGPLVSPPKR